MSKIPVALELYSVRHELQKDLYGTLKAVAQMGYQGVEFAGPPPASGEELRRILDEVGLVCCSWHTPFESVQDDKLEETIALNKAVGNRSIIIPGIPGVLVGSHKKWLKMAEFFNRLSEKLAEHDMVAGYHNHHTEFTPLAGETPWDTLFSNTRQEVVMQLDLGNALLGGADVVSILKKYPGRSDTIHLKPYSIQAGKENPEDGYRPMIGEDDIPWKEVMDLCKTSGNTRWYIIEYESDAYPPLEAVERCLKAVQALEQEPVCIDVVSSATRKVVAETVKVDSSLVGIVTAGQDASVTDSLCKVVVAGASVDLKDCLNVIAVGGKDVNLQSSGSFMIKSGGNAEIKNSQTGVLICQQAAVEESSIGILLTRQVDLGKNVRVFMSMRQVVAMGAVFGLVFALAGALLTRFWHRK